MPPSGDLQNEEAAQALPAEDGPMCKARPGMKWVLGVSACAAAAVIVASVQYVHSGYAGVIDVGDSVRLMDRGFHLRAPWHRVIVYPVRAREFHLEAAEDGPEAKVSLDMVLTVSVCRDSIPRVHRAYGGEYLKRLVSPLALEYLRKRAESPDGWFVGSEDQRVAQDIVEYLDSVVSQYGVNVYQGWMRSYEVVRKEEEASAPPSP